MRGGRCEAGGARQETEQKGARLETIVKVAPVDGRGAAATYKELRYLDADGSLVVEITMTGSPNKRSTVYRRIHK